MAITKQQGRKSGTHREQDGVDLNVSGRDKARMTAKPRSARATMKGPNARKASTARKG